MEDEGLAYWTRETVACFDSMLYEASHCGLEIIVHGILYELNQMRLNRLCAMEWV